MIEVSGAMTVGCPGVLGQELAGEDPYSVLSYFRHCIQFSGILPKLGQASHYTTSTFRRCKISSITMLEADQDNQITSLPSLSGRLWWLWHTCKDAFGPRLSQRPTMYAMSIPCGYQLSSP